MAMGEGPNMRRVGRGLLAFALPLALYLLFPAYSISGDGIKYLYNCSESGLYFEPGHLLYCPLMVLLGRISEGLTRSFDYRHLFLMSHLMLAINQVAGAAGVLFLFRAAQALGLSVFAQGLACFGLAFSYGYWTQATDIETYALAVAVLNANLWVMASLANQGGSTWKSAVLGFLNGLVVLCHLTTLALIPASLALFALLMRNRRGGAARSLAAYLAAVSITLFTSLWIVVIGFLELDTVSDVLRWLKSSDHGVVVTLDSLSIPCHVRLRANLPLSRVLLGRADLGNCA